MLNAGPGSEQTESNKRIPVPVSGKAPDGCGDSFVPVTWQHTAQESFRAIRRATYTPLADA